MTIAVQLRRISARLAIAGLATTGLLALGLATSAAATPTLTLKTAALPIPGFPGTGDALGAGAVIQVEGRISGAEYGGFPPPLIGIRYFAPAGAKLHPRGFASCAPSVLESNGPESCPKASLAGPKGAGIGVVSFGGERVQESASVQPLFAPGGGLELFLDGSTPVSLEILAAGQFVKSSPPFSVEFIGSLPLIETVPGAPDASILQGTVRIGAAYKQGKRTISYVTVPKQCSKGGWPVKVQLSFLGGASAEASYKMPCPKK